MSLSFEICGEHFEKEYFPHVYAMVSKNRANAEAQIKSIADTWHEGGMVSAVQALESDLAHDSGPLEESITLPPQYAPLFNSRVLVARGLRRGLYIYTPEGYERTNLRIDKNIERSGEPPELNYPEFKRFMGAGTHECSVTVDGELQLPLFLYEYLGDVGTTTISQGEDWLEVRKEYEGMCRCNTINCAKCLGGNCTDPFCTIHSPERKAAMRKEK